MKYVNPAGSELAGYSVQELLFKPFSALTHPDDTEELERIYLQRTRGEYVKPGHRFRIVSSDGEVKWVESRSAAIEWDGRPAVLSMIRDISGQVHTEELLRQTRNELDRRVQERTAELQDVSQRLLLEVQERRQMESELQESEERYRFLFDRAPIGLITIDTQGRIQEINQKLLELLGSPSAEASKAINMFTFPLLVNAGLSEVFKSCIEECKPRIAEDRKSVV